HTATVAGTAPAARTAASAARAVSRFTGKGNPWLMSVDSRATTGRPTCTAAATSSRTSNSGVLPIDRTSQPTRVNRPAAVHGQASTRHEVVVEKREHGLGDIQRAALAPDQRGFDGFLAFVFCQGGR